jgi:hypothetical protein
VERVSFLCTDALDASKEKVIHFVTIVKQLSAALAPRGVTREKQESQKNAEKAEIIEILRMVDTMKIMA